MSDLRRNGGIWQGIGAQLVGPAADGDEGMIIPLLAPGRIGAAQ